MQFIAPRIKKSHHKPSRGMSEAKDELLSTGVLNSCCNSERFRLRRGAEKHNFSFVIANECEAISNKLKDCRVAIAPRNDVTVWRNSAFTLAEIKPSRVRSLDNEMTKSLKVSSVGTFNARRSVAFTLAEILITLAIIGVVSAMTIPTLLHNMNARAKTSRLQNIQLKLEQGLTLMNQGVSLKGYSTTEDFVKALSRYMKITTICPNADAYKCWPLSTVNIKIVGSVEQPVDTTSINSPSSLGLNTEKYKDIAGFITADGVPYIVSYDTTCSTDEGKRDLESYCISGIYDWNGGSSPNRFEMSSSKRIATNSDIQLLGDTQKIGGKRVGIYQFSDNKVTIGTGFKANTAIDCTDSSNKDYCITQGSTSYSNDYWAGAVKTCNDNGGTLANQEENYDLSNAIYGKKFDAQGQMKPARLTSDGNVMISSLLGFNVSQKVIHIWSSNYSIGASWAIVLGENARGAYVDPRNRPGYYAICVGK